MAMLLEIYVADILKYLFVYRFSPGAKYFTSSSRDGSIKLWDGVSNKCVNTFHKAHGGAEVCSVLFSRNGKVSASVLCSNKVYKCESI